jgi:hypothetical protein
MGKRDLYLHEEYMLLALRDDAGTIESRASWYSYGLGGAIVAELALRHRIRLATDGKRLVDVVDSAPVGDPLLDEALALMAGAKRRRRGQHWVSKLSGLKRLRHRVAESLCDRRILAARDDKVLLVFRRKVYPTIDPAPERRTVDRLRGAIFGGGGSMDDRTAVLVGLAHVSGLLPAHFDKRELKARKRRLEEIVNGHRCSAAAREAIQAIQAATMAAVIAATTAATASS